MPSAVQLIRSSSLSDVAEYAYAATAPAQARLVFLAGSCPLDEEGRTVAMGDYAGQAAACVATMTAALEAAGASITDVNQHPGARGVPRPGRPGDGVGGRARRLRRPRRAEHAHGRHGARLRRPAR